MAEMAFKGMGKGGEGGGCSCCTCLRTRDDMIGEGLIGIRKVLKLVVYGLRL